MPRYNTKHCQRCGQDHEQLEYKPLSNAVDIFKFWATCPLTGEPILLAIVEDHSADASSEVFEHVTYDEIHSAFKVWSQQVEPERREEWAKGNADYFSNVLRSVMPS